jgi:very-short-patch-repair endonuclease
VTEWDEPPGYAANDLEWLRFQQAGVLSWAQAERHLGRRAPANRLARSRWQRPARAVLVTHSGPVTRHQRLWIAVLAAGRDAVLAGVTAATLEGLRGYDRPAIDVLIPAGRRARPMPGVRLRRTSVLPPDNVRWQDTPPRTIMARSIVDAAAWAATDDDARAIVAAAFQQRRVRAEEVDAVLARMPRSRRRGLVAETARLAAGGAHALSELNLLTLCRRFGLPQPDQQVRRVDRAGRERYLDAYWARWRLHVEVDGAWHLDVRTWWADMQRQNDLWISGDRILRFPAWAVLHEPERVAKQIHAALVAAGWTP